MIKTIARLAAVSCTLALAACGGGTSIDVGPTQTTVTTPTSSIFTQIADYVRSFCSAEAIISPALVASFPAGTPIAAIGNAVCGMISFGAPKMTVNGVTTSVATVNGVMVPFAAAGTADAARLRQAYRRGMRR